jgi:hypothetical protein
MYTIGHIFEATPDNHILKIIIHILRKHFYNLSYIANHPKILVIDGSVLWII